MSDDRIERPSFYDGQRLGAQDFLDEQRYHIDARRRHQLGAHTWGVVHGLSLDEEAVEGTDEVTVTLSPGLMVDGYGRSVVVFHPYRLPATLLAPITGVGYRPVWLAHVDDPLLPEEFACRGPSADRVRESFRVLIGKYDTSEQPDRDPIQIGDETLAPPTPAAVPPGLPTSWSFPHQRFQPAGARWLVRLGDLRIDGPGARFIGGEVGAEDKHLAQTRVHRRLAGVIGGQLYAPEGRLVIADHRGEDLTVDLRGSLQVTGTGTFLGDVRLHGSALLLRMADGKGSPRELRRAEVDGASHVDLVLGKKGDDPHGCFRVGPVLDPADPTTIEPVLSTCADSDRTVTAHGKLRVDELLHAARATVDTELEVGGGLQVTGPALIKGELSTLAGLAVAKSAVIGEDLTVSGMSTLASTKVGGDLQVDGSTDLVGNTLVRDSLRVDGNVQLRSQLDVFGRTSIGDTLSLTGPQPEKLRLGSAAGEVAALGTIGNTQLRYRATRHRFEVSGVERVSIDEQGIHGRLADLDLDLRLPIGSRAVGNVGWTPVTSAAGSVRTRMGAAQAVYVELNGSVSAALDEESFYLFVRTAGMSTERQIRQEAALEEGESEWTNYLWLPAPTSISQPIDVRVTGLEPGSTVTADFTLVGTMG